MEVKNEHIGESNPGTARFGVAGGSGDEGHLLPMGAA